MSLWNSVNIVEIKRWLILFKNLAIFWHQIPTLLILQWRGFVQRIPLSYFWLRCQWFYTLRCTGKPSPVQTLTTTFTPQKMWKWFAGQIRRTLKRKGKPYFKMKNNQIKNQINQIKNQIKKSNNKKNQTINKIK